MQKRPGTTYYERNCKKTLAGPLSNSIVDRVDRHGLPPTFTNGVVADKNIAPSLSTDTQSKI